MNRSPFNSKLNAIADDMGVSLYQRFSAQDAGLFLRCSVPVIESLVREKRIEFLELPDGQIEFFGFQLLEYLLGCVSGGVPTTRSSNPDRIVRIKEVLVLTGLSRTTLWRLEKKGQFPARLPLSPGSVGWRMHEVEEWVNNR